MNPKLHPSSYPQPPWELRGAGMLLAYLVDATAARTVVPEDVHVVRVLPGKTVGCLYAASYGPGSDLEYNELIVAPALGFRSGRIGFWISHIYVDEPQSVAGGREIWGLPKQRAEFSWTYLGSGREVYVSQGGEHLCTARINDRLALPRIPVIAPLLSDVRGSAASTVARGRVRVHLAGAEAIIPEGSPFAPLIRGSNALGFVMDDLHLTLPAPGFAVREASLPGQLLAGLMH